MGIRPSTLAARFSRLYHMAELGSWPSIREHGLLSTNALLDLFEIPGDQKEQLAARHRPDSVAIRHLVHGVAVIRDQKPMDDSGLIRSLRDGLTPAEWYRILNDKVFFWLSEKRLDTLLNAAAYRGKRQTILTVDTATLLERHADRVLLSPINSGCTKPMPQPRGHDTFSSLADYPFDAWDRKRKRRDPVVELTVRYAVPDIRDFVLRVEERGGGQPSVLVWERG
jgi:hypothetical protein